MAATIAIAHAMVFLCALTGLLALVIVFVRWKSLKDRVPIVCIHIFLLVCCAGMACLARGTVDAVVGIACFIWVVVCVATAYAICESRRRLHAFFRNKNAKNFLALTGTVAVAILGIVAWMRLLQWILT
ncbi:hypothetical protein [uncultured Rothia sp.]|uniref:hypothetical protein n=1 Tax=uncultured Rothia sp. TaxID=316088 RepID=UPI0025E3E144|nr:hypothetical protein [uncultured Rothia sp.]